MDKEAWIKEMKECASEGASLQLTPEDCEEVAIHLERNDNAPAS